MTSHHPTPRFRLRYLLAASLALHGAVLCFPLASQTTGESATQSEPMLVTLTSPVPPVTAATRTVPHPRREIPSPRKMIGPGLFADNARAPPLLSMQHEQTEENSASENVDTDLNTLAHSPAAATNDVSIDTHAERLPPDTGIVLARIRASIARERYPELARRHGWEGKVQLGFRVEGSGAIDGIRVTHSSGNRVLDESAMRALQRIRFVPAELWLDGYSAEMQLPVIYRLSES